MNLEELKIEQLLSKYKDLLRNPPHVLFTSDEEFDKYYESMHSIEKEIKERCTF